jgi:predicted MFS family arabinose efflux permease
LISGPQGANDSAKRLHIAFSLLLLTGINLVNYIDRYLISSLLPLIKGDFRLTSTQEGLLGTAFILVYLLAAPLFGWLGDRFSRRPVITAGVALWSLATAASGLARGFGSLLPLRSLVGVGEASYASVSPGLIADYVPPRRRAMAMSFFYMAIPVGAALGYVLGGFFGSRIGWRHTFMLVGGPGLVLALLALFVHEPKRVVPGADVARGGPGFLAQCRDHLFRNQAWIWLTVSSTLYTFAMGGISFWMPSYLVRHRGFTVEESGVLFGIMTVISGLGGTFSGGWLADAMQRRNPGGYVRMCWLTIALSLPFMAASNLITHRPTALAMVFAAEWLLFMCTGPVNTMIVGCVPATLRSTAMAVNIFFIHLFGDALSPALIGWVADRQSLPVALWLIPVAMGLSAATMVVVRYREYAETAD